LSKTSEEDLLPQVRNLFGPHSRNAKWLREEHSAVYETLDDLSDVLDGLEGFESE